MTPIVIIESPYAGDVERNETYAKRAMLDSIHRGEAPLVSHLLYTQVLDDLVPSQRETGIHLHLTLIRRAPKDTVLAVYADYEMSKGMCRGIDEAIACGLTLDYRTIGLNP